MIAEEINSVLDKKMKFEYDRHSKKKKRSKNEIGIHSIRGGTEVGTHSVLFLGEDEKVEIKHSATSRAVFAKRRY